MSIKLTILKTGETLISDMQELVSNKDQATPHAYLLNNPHKVEVGKKSFLTEEEIASKKHAIDVTMTPWILISSDKEIILPVDCVMTIVEPIDGVKKMFQEKNTNVKVEEELNG
tara:strand:+ start:427 stop:768 length:342 start_codon:yes stop_codon:yes gene_type:complete